MNRSTFVNHLYDQDCQPMEDGGSEAGELWQNTINGEVCNVPWDEELALFTWGHILYELRVIPPLDRDSEYDVYSSFREVEWRKQQQAAKQ